MKYIFHVFKINRTITIVIKAILQGIDEASRLNLIKSTSNNLSKYHFVIWIKPVQIMENVKLLKIEMRLTENVKNKITSLYTFICYNLMVDKIIDRFRFHFIERFYLKAIIARQTTHFKKKVEKWI